LCTKSPAGSRTVALSVTRHSSAACAITATDVSKPHASITPRSFAVASAVAATLRAAAVFATLRAEPGEFDQLVVFKPKRRIRLPEESKVTLAVMFVVGLRRTTHWTLTSVDVSSVVKTKLSDVMLSIPETRILI